MRGVEMAFKTSFPKGKYLCRYIIVREILKNRLAKQPFPGNRNT